MVLVVGIGRFNSMMTADAMRHDRDDNEDLRVDNRMSTTGFEAGL